MKQPTLIDVPKDRPSREQRLDQFCVDHWIWTHDSKISDPSRWCALLFEEALVRFGSYVIPKDSKDPIDIIASTCRLLDEANLLVSAPGRWSAVRRLCELNQIPFNP